MQLRFTPLNSNGCQTYLVASSSGDEAWLIDPVLHEVDAYLRLLEQKRLTLTKVIDTHTHADHLSGSAKLRDETGCAYVMHKSAQPKEVTDRLEEQTKLTFDGVPVRILHTPGHTKDSMCLIFPDRILTGDTLFLDDGGAGRDDLPGGDPAEHWESLKQLQALPDAITVYPGHEYRNRKPSDLGRQKASNPFFKPQTKKEYVQFVDELKLGPTGWMKEVLKANCACTRDLLAVHIPQGISACEAQGTMPTCGVEHETISAPQLKELLEKDQDLILLDVRESLELTGELGHLPGIKHLPVGTIEARVAELEHIKHASIITICKMGGRAKTAAQILSQAGFKKVSVLNGGMLKWNELGLPVKREL